MVLIKVAGEEKERKKKRMFMEFITQPKKKVYPYLY
jgi:hypothetical protein